MIDLFFVLFFIPRRVKALAILRGESAAEMDAVDDWRLVRYRNRDWFCDPDYSDGLFGDDQH